MKPGDVLDGRYEILHLTAAGGLERHYEARDRRIDRLVTVSTAQYAGNDDPENRERVFALFSGTVGVLGQLRHPNIVFLMDYGVHDGQPYLVLEATKGTRPLSAFIKDEKWQQTTGVATKLGIVAAACRGLAHAHNHGIVHRDIKPFNLLLGAEDLIPQILFTVLTVPVLTEAREIAGTLRYMPPEQLGGSAVDGRADIFALGATLYELLSGEYAIEVKPGEFQRLKSPSIRPINELLPHLDPALVRVVHKMLEPNVEARYKSANDVELQLQDIQARYLRANATIFISYRRRDGAAAGRLADHLRTYFGERKVFMDVEAIEAGVSYEEIIESNIRNAAVLLPLIADGWAAIESDGTRRIDQPDDMVRREIELALASKIKIIPVVLEGTLSPKPSELPASIRPLGLIENFELRHRSWRADVQSLSKLIEPLVQRTT